MLKNAIVYPYSILFASVLRNLQYDKKYNIIAAIIPGAWYEEGNDASFIDNGEPIGISVLHNYNRLVKQCTYVIWANYDYKDKNNFYLKVLKQMKQALKNKKNIICFQKLDNKNIGVLKNIANENDVIFDYLPDRIENYEKKEKYLDKITVPIITVMGVADFCSKFEIQLILRRLFKKNGYKVSQIGSESCCEIMGFHSFPQFMFYDNFNEIEKIDNFYNYIIDIQKKEDPEVIIIGIPGGIMPLNENYSMNYGITAFEICSVLSPDFNILNLWSEAYDKKALIKMVNILEHRMNAHLDCICLSNICVNQDSIQQKKPLEYNILDFEHTEKNKDIISGLIDIHVYNILDHESYNEIYNQIIDTLSQ